MSDELAKAKAVLLKTLEQLEQAEQDLDGPVDRVDLVVVYSIGRDCGEGWRYAGGWVATPGPTWAHVELLRYSAMKKEEESMLPSDEPEEEDGP